MTDQMGPIEIWQSMGIIGQMVLVFLLMMSVFSITMMIDRLIAYRRARQQSLRFIQDARAAFDREDMDGALEVAQANPRSHVGRIYTAAIGDFRAYDGELPPDFTGTMGRAIDREAMAVTQELKRGLPALATIGATAPFVGLFGTVVGIMNAFFGMARAGQGGIGAVSGGIAEALVNTAVGLFVALPAVWAFNYFVGKVDGFNVEMRTTGSEITDHFVRKHGSKSWNSVTAVKS